MIKSIAYCDICKEQIIKGEMNVKVMAVFTSEQTEGRGCKPYFETVTIDMCKKCLDKFAERPTGSLINVLLAHGAQGNNNYEITNMYVVVP